MVAATRNSQIPTTLRLDQGLSSKFRDNLDLWVAD
jgi:hypothetical protein